MASSDNLMAMEPWTFRSAFGDSWFSDMFSRETETLTKVLQKSLSAPTAPSSEVVLPARNPDTPPVHTPSASGPTGSGISENETATAASKRRKLGPTGNITKRKSRAAKRSTTTYITADVANFRQMVQQITGASSGVAGKLPVTPILKPEPHRLINQLPHTSGCLPTLDTSAFLLDPTNHRQQMVGSFTSLIQPPAITTPPPPPSVAAGYGGASSFDFDSFSSFPTLESWN